MKLFCIFLAQLIVIDALRFQSKHLEHPPAPEELHLRIQTENGIKHIHLERVETFLANENLPIFFQGHSIYSHSHTDSQKTMEKVGKFHMYHDYCSKSAFVYFQKHGTLNGVIDVSYSLTNFPIKKIHNVIKLKSKFHGLIGLKRYLKKSRLTRSSGNNTEAIRSRRDGHEKLEVYPELLVTVSHLMYLYFERDTAKTVQHILTVYNAVDMLFESVESVRIRINIAEIVIQPDWNAWKFVPLLYSKSGHEFVEGEKVNKAISTYFESQERDISRYLYDCIIYNTRAPILDSELRRLVGVSKKAPHECMLPRRKSKFSRGNVAVTDHKNYENYLVIAQELAYVFSTGYDGEDPRKSYMTTCASPTMGCPKHCLKWNRQAEKEFAKFFSSPDGCLFLNKPRSLDPPIPPEKLAAEEQCECS